MSIKGYPSQEKDDRLKAEFATLERVREKQIGLSTVSHTAVYQVVTDIVEAGSTTSVINATAHAALVGDVIRFTSGAFNNREFKVDSVDTNEITLSETLSSAPAAADTFEILRHKYIKVAADGGITTTPGPIQFRKDGVDTYVEEDTVTPANNVPLPVKITGLDGDVVINSSNLNLEVQLSDQGVDADVVRIGDGTEQLQISAIGEAHVKVISELPAGTQNIGDVDVLTEPATAADGALGLPAVTKVIAGFDGANVQAVKTNASGELEIAVTSSALPTGAATEATLSSIDGKLNSLGQKAMAGSVPVVVASDQTSIPVNLSASVPAGTNNIGDVDVLTEPATVANGGALPAVVKAVAGYDGANAQAIKVDANGELQVDVLTLPSIPAGTNNIGDVDVLSLPSIPAGTNNIGDVDVLTEPATAADAGALPSVLKVSAGYDGVNVRAIKTDAAGELQVDVLTLPSIPAGTNNIGDVDVLTLPSIPAGTNNIGDVDVLTEPATAADNAASLPSQLKVVAGWDGTNVHPLKVDSAGRIETSASRGRSAVTTIRNDYSSVNVTTGAWVQLIASLASDVNEIQIFDSSGQTMELGTGGAGAEARIALIFPGGNGNTNLFLASGTRISVRAVSANATVGEIDINFLR